MPKATSEPGGGRYAVPAITKAVQLLEALSAAPGSAGVTELAVKAGVPKSSAALILGTLDEAGLVRRGSDGRYQLGIKLYHLGTAAVQGLDLRRVALPHMDELSRATGHTVHLAILDRGEAVCIEKVAGSGFVQFNTWVGYRTALHLTSYGKCLAAYLPEEEVVRLAAEHGLPRRTPKTVASVDQLVEQLRQFRADGWALEDEEDEPGIRCIAAPIRSAAGQVLAAVSITALSSDLPVMQFSAMAAQVCQAAAAISCDLGYARAPLPR